MIQELIQYQEIDRKLRKIEVELASSDERKKMAERKKYVTTVNETAATLEKRAEDLLERYAKLRNSHAELSKALDEHEELAGNMEMESEEELEYFEKRVNRVAESLKGVEGELANVTREMDETAKAFADLRKKFDQAKEEYKFYREKYEALKASRQDQISAVNAELERAAKSVPAEILEKYQQKRKDKIFPVLVPLRLDSCGGCSMQISLAQRSQLEKNGFIECENCRRVIYLDERA